MELFLITRSIYVVSSQDISTLTVLGNMVSFRISTGIYIFFTKHVISYDKSWVSTIGAEVQLRCIIPGLYL